MDSRPADFMNRSSPRRAEEVPTLTFSKRAATAGSSKSSSRKTVHSVDTLEKLVNAFDESERELRSA